MRRAVVERSMSANAAADYIAERIVPIWLAEEPSLTDEQFDFLWRGGDRGQNFVTRHSTPAEKVAALKARLRTAFTD
jgi:hypothetical protein